MDELEAARRRVTSAEAAIARRYIDLGLSPAEAEAELARRAGVERMRSEGPLRVEYTSDATLGTSLTDAERRDLPR